FEDFRVTHRRLAAGGGGADDFGVNLVELAVASFLRALAAKHWADREELVQATLPEFVLDVGADDAGGVLGAESQGLAFIAFGAAAIFPGKHFFGDNIRLFAYAAGEQFGGLEDRGADFVEVVGTENVADGGVDEVPERRVGRKKVAGSSGGFDHFVVRDLPTPRREACHPRARSQLSVEPRSIFDPPRCVISVTSNLPFADLPCVAYSLSNSMIKRGSRHFFEITLRMRCSLGSISSRS